uniref:NB-ARC domain-containing protein n=1 Tax=Physcomitrium patens TaxID=3218 RepID=A0A2K1IWW0_PHYPA|nr:hypothetical protein PHYPA_023582 [Physcomitrium patens]
MSTNLKELPAKLDAMELEVLLLLNNPLECIHKKFFNNLRSIRILDLRGTKMKALPESTIGRLTGMEELYLDWCLRLSYLPSKLTHLTRLQILNICTRHNLWKTTLWEGLSKTLRGKLALRDLVTFVGLEHLTVWIIDYSVRLLVELLTASKRLQTLKLWERGALDRLPDLRLYYFGGEDGFPTLVNFMLWQCYKLALLPKLEDGAMAWLK